MKKTNRKIIFDYSKLEGRMRERHVIIKELANVINKSISTVSLKLKSKIKFSEEEIYLICIFLEIPFEEINEYFFKAKV